MACAEITSAINWAKQNTQTEFFTVTAYFMKHTGVSSNPNALLSSILARRDYCWYAVGEVRLNAADHLVGDLQLYTNSDTSDTSSASEAMRKEPVATVGVDIFPDGTFTYQHKLKGKPVGGMPPITVAATCLGGVLLTGTDQNEVITIGVRRNPSFTMP